LWIALYFVFLTGSGTIGYMVIEDWSFLDGLYMSVVTATSVGFGETHPLSDTGRIFTLFLLGGSVLGLGLWWALLTALFVEIDLVGVLRRRRMEKGILDASNHYVVCGLGRMGRVIIEELRNTGVPFVAIERDPSRIGHMLELFPDMLYVEGDATKEHTLELARVNHASGLSSCLPDDGDNLLLCITARGLNAQLNIVGRAVYEESIEKLHRAGANHVVSAIATGGMRMAAALVRPSVLSFLDAATLGADISLRLEEIEVDDSSHLAGLSLAEAQISQKVGMVVLGLHRPDAADPIVYNPGPSTRLNSGDRVIVLGDRNQVERLRQYFAGSLPG
jgi:voltage-gated potassium channel